MRKKTKWLVTLDVRIDGVLYKEVEAPSALEATEVAKDSIDLVNDMEHLGEIEAEVLEVTQV